VIKAEHDLPGTEGERVREGQGGEMTPKMYAHVNKRIKKRRNADMGKPAYSTKNQKQVTFFLKVNVYIFLFLFFLLSYSITCITFISSYLTCVNLTSHYLGYKISKRIINISQGLFIILWKY
jgi:hypothetical protein